MPRFSVKPRVACAIAICIAAVPTQAQRFTLEHLRQFVGVGGVELSPDGRTAVITVTRPNYERNRNESELHAVDVATGGMRQLTFERRTIGSARFSPDGRTLAFLAPGSDGPMQVWLLMMDGTGGEARQLTSHPGGVQHFSWRPDGAAIAFAASDEAPVNARERSRLWIDWVKRHLDPVVVP